MTLRFTQMNRADSAFAAAITFLATEPVFAPMPFGPLIETVSGAVKRRHFLIAVEGSRVVGLTCWALATAEIAEDWMTGRRVPTFSETEMGDTVVLTLGGGRHPQVALLGIRQIAAMYPGYPYWMNRVGRITKKRGRFPVKPSLR